MAWTRIHKTVGGNGQVTVNTGYLEETINLLDWSDSGNNGKLAYTSPLVNSGKDDFTVLVDFSHDLSGDIWFRVEHSIDGTTWHNYAQSGTAVYSTTDLTGGADASKISHLDDSDENWDEINYYFVYEMETHGWAKYVRFGIEDNSSADESTYTAKFTIVPH